MNVKSTWNRNIYISLIFLPSKISNQIFSKQEPIVAHCAASFVPCASRSLMAFWLVVAFIVVAAVEVIVAFVAVVVEYWNKCQWYWHFRYVFSTDSKSRNWHEKLWNHVTFISKGGVGDSSFRFSFNLLLFLFCIFLPEKGTLLCVFVLVSLLLFGLFGFDLTFVNTSVCSILVSFAFGLM